MYLSSSEGHVNLHVIKLHRTKYTHILPQDTDDLPGTASSQPVYTKFSKDDYYALQINFLHYAHKPLLLFSLFFFFDKSLDYL